MTTDEILRRRSEAGETPKELRSAAQDSVHETSTYTPKFGRRKNKKGEPGKPGKAGIGFKLTSEGHYDIENKRITNLGEPYNDGDACTKKYLTGEFERSRSLYAQDAIARSREIEDRFIKNNIDISNILKDYATKTELSGYHEKNKDLDMNNKLIKNLSSPYDDNDAVNKDYLFQYSLLLDNTIKEFNANNHKIINVANPTTGKDVATKLYVDSSLESERLQSQRTLLSSIQTATTDLNAKIEERIKKLHDSHLEFARNTVAEIETLKSRIRT